MNTNFIPGDQAAKGMTIHQLLQGRLPNFLSRDKEDQIAHREEQARGYAIRRSWESHEAFRARLDAFTPAVPVEKPTLGMAPQSARRELTRLMRASNPGEYAKQINEYERILGIPTTDFSRAAQKKTNQEDPAIAAAFATLQQRFKRPDYRANVVKTITDLRLLKMIMELDKREEVRKAAEERMGVVAAGGAVSPIATPVMQE